MEGAIPDLKDILEQNNSEEESITKFNSLDSMKELLEAVDTNTNNSLNKSWSKLNKTNKLKLINNFIEIESKEKNIDKSKLEKLLHTSFKNGLLNKQSIVDYDIINNVIKNIKILKYDKKTNIYEIKVENNMKVQSKPKSKSNIDKLLNKSKKNR
tara:strand:+ start:41 stop:505 length:465 start_codon:yes stop_codon:yes gene_type:complete